MTKLNEMIFLDSYPKLDLHGYDRESARVAINDFIKDNIKTKNELITIIHGRGTGILRETTKNTLNKNPNVLEFKTHYFNEGCTIVHIKINKSI